MKKILLYSLLFLTTILWAEEEVVTTYTKAENSSESKKIPVAIGVQGSYLFHMYNDSLYSDFNEPLNANQFNHGGVGLNITIGSAQKFHTVIYGGVSFYQNIDLGSRGMYATSSKNDHIGGKLTVDFIPINVKLGKSLSTFYSGVGIGFDTVFDPNAYIYDGAFYGLLNLRVPIGFAFRVSKELEFYIQNAFQFGVEFTGVSADFSITSDLEFGIKFWIK